MKRGQCGTGVRLDDLSVNDRVEVAKFTQWIAVEAARKKGADPAACDMLEAAIYPDGIGRETPKGDA